MIPIRHLLFRTTLGFSMLASALILLSLLAGHILPYIGELAYIATPTGINRLYLMDVQRQFHFHITEDFVNDCCLTWSPDGHTLTYVRDTSSDGSTDIFSNNFQESVRRLTTAYGADLYPTYSPDGRQIAYTSVTYGNSQIYLMNADGSQPRMLTGQKGLVNLNPRPVWSADGQSIIFSDFGNLNSLYAISNNCVQDCDSTIRTVFKTNGLPLMTTSFIPLDQSRLILAAYERTPKGGYGFYSLDTDSSKAPERLTINANLASPAVAINDHWLAFVSGNTNLQTPVDEANLYILDTDCVGAEMSCANSLQQVANELQTDDNLSWSADGRWLAFVTVSRYISRLNILDTTCIREHQDCTDYIQQLPVSSSRYIRPAWRPPIQ